MNQPAGIPEILNGGGELVFVGAVLVVCCFVAWAWVRSIGKAARRAAHSRAVEHAARYAEQHEMFGRQLNAAKSRYEKHLGRTRKDLGLAHRDSRALSTDNARLQRKAKAMRRQAALRQRKLNEARQQLSMLQTQLAELQTWDGKLWERPLDGEPPVFVAPSQRRARLISIINLKGGVGKTTLTANLGVTLARRGRRVLMVDLDFQYSLTSLCISTDQRMVLRQQKLTVSRLLDAAGGPSPGTVQQLLLPVRGLPKGVVCDVMPAEDELADAEQRAQARWLMQSLAHYAPDNGRNGNGTAPAGPDARFLFRQAFHASPLLDRYDYVLFDCPPRLTTTAVNALACCDFLLIPALLDQLSVDALPRTLAHLDRLAHLSQARLLGVVGNRAKVRGDHVIVRQRSSFDGLLTGVRLSKYTRSEPFRAIVRDSGKIGEAANEGCIAAAEDDGMELFNDLADAVERGVKDALPDEVRGEVA